MKLFWTLCKAKIATGSETAKRQLTHTTAIKENVWRHNQQKIEKYAG